ncbi:MAG TPA: hypothetical protein PKM88_00780 [bacterium]|nr:hypothetical protein [bacterium]
MSIPSPRAGRLLLIFIDGLGLGAADPRINPVAAAGARLLPVAGMTRVALDGVVAAADARLGVAGIPQSATGQTALFTGYNAPRLVGAHCVGFPRASLRRRLLRRNLLLTLRRQGRRAEFVNAYPRHAALLNAGKIRIARDGRLRADGDVPPAVLRRLSVTTVSALTAGQRFRDLADLQAGRAVYHDFTNRILRELGEAVPLLTPAQAGRQLWRCARDLEFALYEHFLTDRAGHHGDFAAAVRRVKDLDAFLAALLAGALPAGATVLLTSDHGNLEDLRARQHTGNPVPVVAWGPQAVLLTRGVRKLTELYPRITAHMAAH